MLRILQERDIWWPIVVSLPSDSGNVTSERGEIKVKYPITRDTIGELSLLRDEAVAPGAAKFITDWRGPLFQDENGHDAPYSLDALAAILKIPAVSMAMQLALLDIANGKAAIKNSKTGASGT